VRYKDISKFICARPMFNNVKVHFQGYLTQTEEWKTKKGLS